MSRPVQYDKQTVLDKAVDVFWSHGYEATSMDLLVNSTGLNRQSMYKLFGGKQAFFHQALKNYIDRFLSRLLSVLEDNRGLESIEDFFRQFRCMDANRGCLVTNTAVEKAMFDNQCRKIINQFYDQLQALFGQCLAKAREDGDLRDNLDISALAKQLLCLAQGMGVYGKVRSSQKDCDVIVNSLLELIRA